MSNRNKENTTIVKEEANSVEELEAEVATEEEEVADSTTPGRFVRCVEKLDMLQMFAIIVLIKPAMLSNNLHLKEILHSKLSILKTVSTK